MGREHLHFGGGVSQTVLNPFVLALVIVAGIVICVASRRRAIAAFLVVAILIPMDQVLLIRPAHFPMLRVLLLFGIIRILREKVISKVRMFTGGMNKMDIAIILLTILIAVNGILLFQESGAAINQLGNLYTVFGTYFLLRFLIRDREDVMLAIRMLACIAVVVAVVMSYEAVTGHNPYASLQGARASSYASLALRDDRFRAQGPFGHSILAGTFGAVLTPVFVGLWWKAKQYRKMATVGTISSTIIMLASNSSTPVLAYVAGILALCLWPARRWMRAMRWGMAVTLVALHVVMRAPVWHLISRIDITGGSSGWHRYMLVDQCIRHFGDWWLFGVKDTGVWGWDMWDTANEYVSVCENSGFLPFVLFLAVLVYGFIYLGRARRAAEKDKRTALFLWALGAGLFANAVAFFGISYFDQTMVAWYALLAMIPAATSIPANKNLVRVPVERPSQALDSLPPLSAEPFGEPALRLDSKPGY